MNLFFAVLLYLACIPALAAETFEEAWQNRWRPSVTSNIFSRRYEPKIKAAAEDVWKVAQANAGIQDDEAWVKDWCEKTGSTLKEGKNNGHYPEWSVRFPDGKVLETDSTISVSRSRGIGVIEQPSNYDAKCAWKELRRSLSEGKLIEGEVGYEWKPGYEPQLAEEPTTTHQSTLRRSVKRRRFIRRGLFR